MEEDTGRRNEEMSKLADEYGRLGDEWYRLTKAGPVLREKILKYFTETGQQAIEGAEYRVKAVERKRWLFRDRKAALDVLESAGLSHLVMSPDWEVMTTILDDPDLPWGVRRQLEKLAERKTIIRLDAKPVESRDDA